MVQHIDPSPAHPARPSGSPGSGSFSLPRPPQPPERRGFPLVATLAPVLGSMVLWAVTHSPYVLVFAMLGPLVAVASLGDSALQGRKKRAKEAVRFAADVAASDEAIVREHEAERSDLAARHRALRELLRAPVRDVERWRATLDAELPVVIGSGAVASRLAPDVASSQTAVPAEFLTRLGELRERAAVVRDAPIVVDARLGIGVCGPPALASSVARGIVLQLANQLSPAGHEIIVAAGQTEDWLAALPHPVAESAPEAGAFVFRSRGKALFSVMVAVAETADELPRDCRVTLSVATVSLARLRPLPAGVVHDELTPEFVSREQAHSFATVLTRAAESAGLTGSSTALPDAIAFETLYPPSHAPHAGHPVLRRDSLECTPVAAASGAVTLDLVRDGPHAIIGGTTGSGKSELLIAWVLAMAATHSPTTVTFLLVDFKGGSSFAAVQDLPHCVGLITDLDENSARRALTSLRAELRYRERALAEAGVRSIEQLPQQHPLARLVIVVDEFAAMVQDFPELHELFADIAARGRSLGVHLILCTQRPAGVVRDAILANCTLRISLRVTNAADSSAVIGSGAAAELPRLPLGRALLCVAGEEARMVQVALVDEDDVAHVGRRWTATSADAPPRRPWCDPPPETVPLADLIEGEAPGGGGIVFGLVDLPQEQRLDLARYNPREQGSLMVIGGHSSGKSGLLEVLLANGSVACERVPREQEGAWDALTERLAAVRAGAATPALLLIDDLDALLGSFSEEYAHALSEVVAALLREGGAATHLVITARRLSPSLQSIAALCDSRLVLRMPDKQEHVAAGGEPRDFDSRLRPGGGHWGGHRVQLAVADERPVPRASGPKVEARDWGRWGGLVVVAAHPAELLSRLGGEGAGGAASHIRGLPGWQLTSVQGRSTAELTALSLDPAGARRVFLADPETWQSQWGVFGALRARLPILFDGCGTADFRALSRLRELPPPIAPGSAAVWLLTPDGRVERATPSWAEAP